VALIVIAVAFYSSSTFLSFKLNPVVVWSVVSALITVTSTVSLSIVLVCCVQYSAVLCYAMLCYSVLCIAVLNSAVLWSIVYVEYLISYPCLHLSSPHLSSSSLLSISPLPPTLTLNPPPLGLYGSYLLDKNRWPLVFECVRAMTTALKTAAHTHSAGCRTSGEIW
jgi:hypothetical protein